MTKTEAIFIVGAVVGVMLLLIFGPQGIRGGL